MAPPVPDASYLDRLMRRESFQALWPLFAQATKPAKELTESFSALEHLRPLLPKTGPYRVIHIGDGAHARTAALFAIKTKAENVSVDPLINRPLVERWIGRFGIERVSLHPARIEAVIDELNALPPMPVFVTFVHAHVRVDHVLSRLNFEAAFTLACCQPGKQLSTTFEVQEDGEDNRILSPHRRYQVLLPTRQEQRPCSPAAPIDSVSLQPALEPS